MKRNSKIKVILNGQVLDDEEAIGWLEYWHPKPQPSLLRRIWDFLWSARVS